MGSDIQVDRDFAVITGVDSISGAPVIAHDLRAGAAMIIAGLMAQGYTEIHDLIHVDRGYEFLVEKLTGLGAEIKRVPVESDPVIVPEGVN